MNGQEESPIIGWSLLSTGIDDPFRVFHLQEKEPKKSAKAGAKAAAKATNRETPSLPDFHQAAPDMSTYFYRVLPSFIISFCPILVVLHRNFPNFT